MRATVSQRCCCCYDFKRSVFTNIMNDLKLHWFHMVSFSAPQSKKNKLVFQMVASALPAGISLGDFMFYLKNVTHSCSLMFIDSTVLMLGV